jgi:TPR repeat protein
LRSSAHYLKLAVAQGHAVSQCLYGECLRSGLGFSIDWRSAARHLKLAADQGNASGRSCSESCLLDGTGRSEI